MFYMENSDELAIKVLRVIREKEAVGGAFGIDCLQAGISPQQFSQAIAKFLENGEVTRSNDPHPVYTPSTPQNT